jgi:hypothetical protein
VLYDSHCHMLANDSNIEWDMQYQRDARLLFCHHNVDLHDYGKCWIGSIWKEHSGFRFAKYNLCLVMFCILLLWAINFNRNNDSDSSRGKRNDLHGLANCERISATRF